jgi:hypothetical protein
MPAILDNPSDQQPDSNEPSVSPAVSQKVCWNPNLIFIFDQNTNELGYVTGFLYRPLFSKNNHNHNSEDDN